MTKSNQQINKEAPDPATTPAVIAYRVGQLEIKVDERADKVEDKIDKLAEGFAPIYKVNEHEFRIKSLESDRKWIVRIIIGTVAMAVLALIGAAAKLNP